MGLFLIYPLLKKQNYFISKFMIETFQQRITSKTKVVVLILVLQCLNFQCFSKQYKELEPDDLLEQELRAEPEKFRDSESREFREKEESKKSSKKK
jgi:hypothetical protein